MSDFGSNVKKIWLKGMEAIGNTASNIASNTKSKVDEMNLVNRRSEIMKDFGNQAYALWQKGEHFPEELDRQLRELQKLDEKLNDLRAERFAGVKANSLDTGTADEENPEADESEAAAQEADENETRENGDAGACTVPVQNEPEVKNAEDEKNAQGISDAINDLFEKAPSSKETIEKVNSALDTLEDGIRQFGSQLDDKLDELSKKL